MSAEQNKTVIKKLFEQGMNERKFEMLKDIIGPDFINHGIPNANRGPEGFKEVLGQFLTGYPDMKINLENIIADGDMVATRGYWTGTNNGSFMGIPATGKKVKVDFIDVWKMLEGKCQENWVQMDMMGLMQQIGMAPATA
jgi:steroid delta-isomerase-like uncharacterized protein